MKKGKLVMSGFLVFIFVFTAVASADGIKEGQWSMTMTTKVEGMSEEDAAMMKEMEDMPAEAMAMMEQMSGQMGVQLGMDAQGMKTTVTQCVTKEKPVPETESSENCEQTHEIEGNTVNFSVQCSDKNSKTESTGHVTYAGDSMEGLIKSKQTDNGHSMDATISIAGIYLGPCQ